MVLFQQIENYRSLTVAIGADYYELGDIIVYNQDGLVASTGKSYFDDAPKTRDSYCINTTKPLVRRNKINLTRAEPFVLLISKGDASSNSSYALYIPESDLPLTETKYELKYGMFVLSIQKSVTEPDYYHFQKLCKMYGSIKEYAKDDYDKAVAKLYVDNPMPREKLKRNIDNILAYMSDWERAVNWCENYAVEDYLREIGKIPLDEQDITIAKMTFIEGNRIRVLLISNEALIKRFGVYLLHDDDDVAFYSDYCANENALIIYAERDRDENKRKYLENIKPNERDMIQKAIISFRGNTPE